MSGVYSEESKEAQIKAQNELLKKEYNAKTNSTQNPQINNKKAVYQTEMYESLKTVNTYLLFFYYFLFIIIHVLFAEQYFRGIKRDEVVDSIWFTIFFVYPAVIYYVETYIYFGIMYVLSFIYGNTYVYNFDKMLLNTSFYVAPNPDTTNSAMPSMTGVHLS
jgi:hypothetical protein